MARNTSAPSSSIWNRLKNKKKKYQFQHKFFTLLPHSTNSFFLHDKGFFGSRRSSRNTLNISIKLDPFHNSTFKFVKFYSNSFSLQGGGLLKDCLHCDEGRIIKINECKAGITREKLCILMYIVHHPFCDSILFFLVYTTGIFCLLVKYLCHHFHFIFFISHLVFLWIQAEMSTNTPDFFIHVIFFLCGNEWFVFCKYGVIGTVI